MALSESPGSELKVLVHEGLQRDEQGPNFSEEHAKEVIRAAMGRASLFRLAEIKWWVRTYMTSTEETDSYENTIAEEAVAIADQLMPNGKDFPSYGFFVEHQHSRCFLVMIWRKTNVRC